MSLLAELSARKGQLKQTGKQAQPKVETKTPQEREWFLTNIDLWYESVQKQTMETLFLPLFASDANALCAEFSARQSAGDSGSASAETKSAAAAFVCKDDGVLRALESLVARIDKGLQALKGSGFVKLSCRSPKDATVCSPEMQAIYRSKLKSLPASLAEGPLLANRKVCALYEAHLQALRMTSGRQAVDLFVRSQRIFEDLQLAIQNKAKGDAKSTVAAAGGDAKSEAKSPGADAAASAAVEAAAEPAAEVPFPVQVVLREWIELPIAGEFRGFVCGRKLTGLSQYFDILYFEDVHKNKQTIAKRVQDFFEKEVRNAVPFDEYIIDFAVTPDRVFVVELNPFTTNTDAGLFAWTKDKEVLTKGPFEIRVVEKPSSHLPKLVFEVWKPLLEWKHGDG